jgi:hypothetical protein
MSDQEAAQQPVPRGQTSLGDRIRQWAGPIPTYSVMGTALKAIAAQADRLEQERDEWKTRRDSAVEECRFLHQDGLSRRDWHAKHCGAVEVIERVEALISEWEACGDGWPSAARQLRKALAGSEGGL